MAKVEASRRECVRLASMILRAYKPSEAANDPKLFISACAAIFAKYGLDTAREVSDPVNGLPSTLKWFPTLADITEACKRVSERLNEEHYLREQLRKQFELREACEKFDANPRGQMYGEFCAEMKQRGLEIPERHRPGA
jgi:hypothetical protein